MTNIQDKAQIYIDFAEKLDKSTPDAVKIISNFKQ
jgi:hypothetical protein